MPEEEKVTAATKKTLCLSESVAYRKFCPDIVAAHFQSVAGHSHGGILRDLS
jgi:hypothetical protein